MLQNRAFLDISRFDASFRAEGMFCRRNLSFKEETHG